MIQYSKAERGSNNRCMHLQAERFNGQNIFHIVLLPQAYDFEQEEHLVERCYIVELCEAPFAQGWPATEFWCLQRQFGDLHSVL